MTPQRSILKVDLSKLDILYRRMSDSEFSAIKRKDLVASARPVYDRERKRRGIPAPKVAWPDPPDINTVLRDYQRDLPLAGGKFLVIVFAIGVIAMYTNAYVLLGPGFVAAYYLSKSTKRANLILWLRRFHDRKQRDLGFRSLIAGACAGWGFAITVQDSSFKRSVGLAIQRAFLGFYGIAFLFPFLLSALSVVFVYHGNEKVDTEYKVLTILVMAIALGTIAYQRSLYCRLTGPDVLVKTQSILKRLEHQGLGFQNLFTHDIHILACEDASWRTVVLASLAAVSAVVIDVTEPSENVLWEVTAAFQLRPPGSIVLAFGTHGETRHDLPRDIYSRLLCCVPEANLRRSHVFAYSLEKNGLHERARLRQLANTLATAIAEGRYWAAVRTIQDEIA